jgi:hypothetical protein
MKALAPLGVLLACLAGESRAAAAPATKGALIFSDDFSVPEVGSRGA